MKSFAKAILLGFLLVALVSSSESSKIIRVLRDVNTLADESATSENGYFYPEPVSIF